MNNVKVKIWMTDGTIHFYDFESKEAAEEFIVQEGDHVVMYEFVRLK